MKAARVDFQLQQGATWSKVVEWKDEDDELVDMDLWEPRMQVRKDGPWGTVIYDLSVGEGIEKELHGPGTVDLMLTAEQASAAPLSPLVYDLEFHADGRVVRLLEGRITVSAEVTRVVT